MRPYSTFTAEDFACDEDFLQWVKYPGKDPLLDAFWRRWLRENPDKREIIAQARQLIHSVIEEEQYFPEEMKQDEVWERIVASAQLREEKKAAFPQSWYAIAAAIVAVLGLGWYFISPTGEQTAIARSAKTDVQYVQLINNAEAPKSIVLSDGTSIILQPKSVLQYPETFRPDVREVFLTGQAFFEVARDVNRPFLVHSGEIVTRVLGTSFIIRNFQGEENVIVQVKSGKVSVFKAKDKERSFQNNDKNVEGVVLVANQQVTFQGKEMKMTKSLVENPTMLIPSTHRKFEFVDTPIKDVFFAIEEAYGIDIVFDEEALSSCYLNASLSEVSLHDKLKLICKGINTTYEIIDSHIVIYGTGCDEAYTPNPN